MTLKKQLILFFIFLYSFAFSQQTTLNLVCTDKSLSEVITLLEEKYNFLFSYKESDIENIRISTESNQTDIDSFLKKILQNTGLQYEVINDNYIILKKPKNPADPLSQTNHSPAPGLPVLCGSIVDSATQKPLAFASIYFKNKEKGCYAAEDGTFRFNSIFSKNDTLVVSYVGYQPVSFPASFFYKNNCPKIELAFFRFREGFIIVTDYLTDGIGLAENGAATVLRPNHIGALPGQAEPDVFTTLHFLPGINSPTGETSNMFVRGGAPDQNLILWENIPIYHGSHFFGMISAVNPYIIDKIKVYRGGFGPEYGGRASSVIDMQSAGYDLSKSTFGAGMNFLNAYAHGQIAAPPGRAGFVYSLRRSISGIWRSPTFESLSKRNQQNILLGNLRPGDLPPGIIATDYSDFTDSHFKMSLRLSPTDKISGAFFYTEDNFKNNAQHISRKLEQNDILKLKSNGFSFNWEHQWGQKFSTRLLGLSTLFDYDYDLEFLRKGNTPLPDRFSEKNNKVREGQFHFSNHYTTAQNHEIDFGYQHINYHVGYLIRNKLDDLETAKNMDNLRAAVNVFYGNIKSPANKKTGVEAGLRINYYDKKHKSYFGPRFKFWHHLSDHWSLQANAGRYFQFVGQLVELKGDFAGIQTPIWIIANDQTVPVLESSQFQLGLIFNKNTWLLDVQAYIKKINNLTSLATGFDPTPQHFDIGSSLSRGIDILAKKRWKKTKTWISYSLSSSTYHFKRFFDPDFRAPFDLRHVFSWVGQYNAGPFQCSLGFHISSGVPYSTMTDIRRVIVNDRDLFLPVFHAYNDKTLPPQHHLNASLLYKIKPPEHSRPHTTIGLSFFNIYNQKNLFSREYYIELFNMHPVIKVSDKEALGFTPNAVVRLEW